MKKYIIMVIFYGLLAIGKDFQKIEIDGCYMEAFVVAMNDFLKIKDLTQEQKKLRYYTIRFSENNESYLIKFVGKIMSQKDIDKYNRITFGRGVQYTIMKNNLVITKRLFSK